MAAEKLTLEERFWSKVLKTDGCWLWQRQVNNNGYGRFLYFQRTSGRTSRGLYAHRVSWMISVGPIPEGMRVLHKCDTPACVRPDHLFIGTQRDNSLDMRMKGRGSKPPQRRTHLTEADRFAISVDPRSGGTIAYEYGVSRSLVFQIKRRKHVE